MCNPADIQHKIHSFTKDGEHIARFLTETMRGKTPGVKVCHRMEAAKHLIRYGFPDTDCETTPDRLSRAGGNPVGSGAGRGHKNTPSPLTGEGWDGGEDSPSTMSAPVTHIDILNYQIAHLIRHETAEGHTIVNFLVDIMSGRDRPFTPRKFRIKPADRYGSSKRTPAPRLRRPRLTPQAFRHHRRSKHLRHPAHRPSQAYARVQRARHRHHPLPARIDV